MLLFVARIALLSSCGDQIVVHIHARINDTIFTYADVCESLLISREDLRTFSGEENGTELQR